LEDKEIDMAGVIDDADKVNKTIEELWECLHYDEDIPVSLRQLRYAVLRGELVPTKLSNRNYYSLRDGLNWVAAQKGKYRSQSKLAR
jgi:hypothetical protein